MPILASTQVVEADAVRVPINFVTEPEYPIVPVQTQPPRNPTADRVVGAIDVGTGDSTSVSTFVAVNGQYYSMDNGLLIPVNGTATTNTTFVSTAVTGFYRSSLSDWSVTTSTTASTCISTSGIYVSNASFWVHPAHAKPFTAEERARMLRRQELRAAADRKKAKGSIKRAIKTMLNLGFEEEARIFLRGDTVEVSHPESLLKFVISKHPNSLFNRTLSPGYSTPYSLSVYTKSDVFVAKLCVYMDRTPILDQVMALALFIKSGSEEMILKKANWYSKTKDSELREILALEYPYLSSKLR